MVAGIRTIIAAAALAAALSIVGCNSYSTPQIADDGTQKKMTPEDAQKAKAEAADKFAKGYQNAVKRFGKDPAHGQLPPEAGH